MSRSVSAVALAFFVVICLEAAAAPDAPYRADRILIKPGAGVDLARVGQFHAAAGSRVVRQFSAFENIQSVQLRPGRTVPEAIQQYQRSGLVEFAEPDFQIFLAATPNDPRFADGSLWQLHNTGQNGGVADADIDAPEAWDTANTASNIVVAIVDTGIRYTHQDLAANMWVNLGETAGNGVDDDGNGYIDDVHGINAAANSGNPVDLEGHGTQVAGVAGAVGNNALGVCGVAWRVKLMACRYMDDRGVGYITEAIECIDYARRNGAHIINASWILTAYVSSLYTAINNCRSAGIIFVAAAGNDAVNNDATPYYPASFNLDNIVAVAATTRTDGLADYSNYGATSVDLAAPGSSLYTTYHTSDSAYALNSGTSFSSPMVAGAFALARARYPSENYRQLIDRLLAATDPLPVLSGKCVTGGRLNLHKTVGPSLISDFVAGPMAGVPPLTVRFTNTSFGTISGYFWNFGDGSSSTQRDPSHVYNSEGNFTVTLTVSNAAGQTASKSRLIEAVANYQVSAGAYSWIDPSSMRGLTLGNDGVSSAEPLPFPFSFYGRSFSQIYVGANGLLGFDSAALTQSANTDLPNTAAPNGILAPFWDDLNPGSGSVRVGTAGTAPNRKFVVSWVSVPATGGGQPASHTFQVWLEEGTSRIQFQYQNVNPSSHNNSAAGKTATVGVEHSSGLVAARYSYNGSTLLNNSQAILFAPTSSGGIVVTPTSSFAASGLVGGPFSPASQIFAIMNNGTAAVNWSVAKSQNWLSLSASSGSLSPGASTNILVSINSAANALPAGSYLDTLAFQNVGSGIGNTTRSVTLTVNGTTPVLSVSPDANLNSTGNQGGPFSPMSQLYTLLNSGDAALTFAASVSEPWLSLSRTNGALAAGESTTVTLSINDAAALLPGGTYSDTVVFENLSNALGNTSRSASLAVYVPPLLSIVSVTPVSVKVHGVSGFSYTLYRSADLVNWTAVATNAAGIDGTALFSDGTAQDHRFYRAALVP